MENKLTPRILVAMPTLQDPYFEKTVILLFNYNEDGAFGIIVNMPSTTRVREILTEHMHIPESFNIPLMIGGPVQPESFWSIHSVDFKANTTTKISSQILLSSAQDVLLAVANGEGPEICHIGCGYAGWSPGQLDREIQEEAWWLGELDESIIMELPYHERWETTLQKLGFNPLMASYVKTGQA